jgi:hypothetical protein
MVNILIHAYLPILMYPPITYLPTYLPTYLLSTLNLPINHLSTYLLINNPQCIGKPYLEPIPKHGLSFS